MSHVTIIVDNDVLLDDALDQWQQHPPKPLQEYLNPHHQPKPWVKPMMVVLADAAIQNESVRIEIVTHSPGFTMHVEPQ